MLLLHFRTPIRHYRQNSTVRIFHGLTFAKIKREEINGGGSLMPMRIRRKLQHSSEKPYFEFRDLPSLPNRLCENLNSQRKPFSSVKDDNRRKNAEACLSSHFLFPILNQKYLKSFSP